MLIVLVNWGSYDVTAESVGDLVAEDDGELVVVVVIAHLQHSRVDEDVPGLETRLDKPILHLRALNFWKN